MLHGFVQIDMPDEAGRQAILRVLLSRENVAPDVDYAAIAAATPNYSGSDLKV
jgi:ATP-dependent Zn protease